MCRNGLNGKLLKHLPGLPNILMMPTISTIAASLSLSRIQELLQKGLISEAALLCESALSSGDNSAAVYRLMGECCLGLGDLKSARIFTDQALQREPDDPETLNNAGVLCFQSREYQTAMNLLQRSLDLRGDYLDAHLNLLDTYGRLTLADPHADIKTGQLVKSLKWISANHPDPARQELVAENRRLRQELLAKYHNRRRDSKLRILLHSPDISQGALYYIFESWQQCLEYQGIPTKLATRGHEFNVILESFAPTCLLSIDSNEVLDKASLNALDLYSRNHALKLGLCSDFSGQLHEADFRITFHLDPARDPVLSRQTTPVISLPFAFNPVIHFAHPGRELWDFAFVGTNSPLKQEETSEYLVPIVRSHSGILAGTGWPGRFGKIGQSATALLYGMAAICPNFHLKAQREVFGEINERTHVLAAVGAFQLVDSPAALAGLYDESELAIANTSSKFHQLFAHYLSKPEMRLQMSTKAMRKAWSKYSQFHVLDRLLEFLSKRS